MTFNEIISRLRKFMHQNLPKSLEQSFMFTQDSMRQETGVKSHSLISFIEELSLNAWPSLQTIHYDGWVLRFGDGYTRRANSINPVFSSSANLDEKIKTCETMFKSRNLNVVFKMTPLVYPDNLDTILAKKWYQEEAITSVQTCDLSSLEKPSLDAVMVSETLTDNWLNAYTHMNGTNERHIPTLKQILNNIVPRHCFISLLHENEIAAVGLGVVERGYVGLFDIVTDERLRRRGLGQQLVLHLLNWGKGNGAAQAYLQVMLNNAPARHLYSKLGFQEVYQYWYRVKQVSG
jgi:N-acetylglutamate synthase